MNVTMLGSPPWDEEKKVIKRKRRSPRTSKVINVDEERLIEEIEPEELPTLDPGDPPLEPSDFVIIGADLSPSKRVPVSTISPVVVTPSTGVCVVQLVNNTDRVWKAPLVLGSLVWVSQGKHILDSPKVKTRLLRDVRPGENVELHLSIPKQKPPNADSLGLDVLLDGEMWLGIQVSVPLLGW